MSSHIILENSQRFNNNDMSENKKRGEQHILSRNGGGFREISSELGARGTTELLKRLGNGGGYHTPKNVQCMQKSPIFQNFNHLSFHF